jgi:hypothetical protein
MQADRLQQERATFEEFLLREGWQRFDLARDDGDYYASSSVRSMWAGWLMRVKHADGVKGLDDGQQ